MSLFSMFDSKVTGYRLPITQDSYGGTLQAELAGLTPRFSNIPCSYQESGPSTKLLYGQRNTTVSSTIYFGREPKVEVSDVVVVTNTKTKEVIYCNVIGQAQPISLGRLWTVAVERIRQPVADPTPTPVILPVEASTAPSVLIDRLVAYWTLDEASGTRFDSIGRGNDLTSNNSVGQGVGKVGNCATFVAASTQSLTKTSNGDLQTGNVDFGVALWFKLTGSSMCVAAKANSAGRNEWYCYVPATGKMQFSVCNASAEVANVLSTAAVNDGNWHLAVCTQDTDNNRIGISIDGGAFNFSARTATPTTNALATTLGSFAASGNSLTGSIDEAGFWKRLLTATDVTLLYNSGTGRTYPFSGT